MFGTGIFIGGLVICIIMALYLIIKAGRLSTMQDKLKSDIKNYSSQFGKLQDINITLENKIKLSNIEFDEKEQIFMDDSKKLQAKLEISETRVNYTLDEKEVYCEENIKLKEDIKANYIELAKFTKLSEEKKELIKMQKKDIKEIKEYHEKCLDENNILIKNYKAQLSEVSGKINKIVTYVIEENQDEDLEELLKEFDAFYIINACLIKYKRVNENQAMIHIKSRKHYQEREREYKRTKDRLRTLCIKYGESFVINKCNRNKKK